MPVLAVIFDAFGTLVKISEGVHPYRRILKLGIEQGRRPQPSDAKNLMTLPMNLRQAADFFGIHVDPNVMAQLEADLFDELEGIQAYNDGLSSVETLKDAGIKVVVCSNLAKPYASAIERLYPNLDGYVYSFEVGAVKPELEIYEHAMQLVNVSKDYTWMIGDSKQYDCDTPTSYGIRGFFLDRYGDQGFNTLHQFTAEICAHNKGINN
ncbi:HAD family hydrolase [Pseudomonas mohnii]